MLTDNQQYEEPWKILEELDFLGKGSFSQVVKAIISIKKQKQLVAIKRIKLGANSAYNELFYREISIHRQLNHTNIVSLLAHHKQGNFISLALEYMDGHDLFSILYVQRIIIKPPEWAFIAIGLFSALDYLHAEGFLHRDIKIENILFNRERTQVKLCDFGFAIKENDHDTACYIGTKEYLAPEIAKARLESKEYPLNRSTDVFELTLSLYQIVAQTDYYQLTQGKSRQELLTYISKGITIECRQDTPALHYKIIRSGLTKKPNDRISTQYALELLRPLYNAEQRQYTFFSPNKKSETNIDEGYNKKLSHI